MHTRRTVVAVVALCALFVSAWMIPDAAASEGTREPARPLAEMTIGASQVDWQPTVEYERVVLTVAGPGDLFIRRELDAGQIPFLTLSEGAGGLLPDGTYTYELRFVQRTGRPSGQPLVLSGYLSVQGGSFVTLPPGKSEPADEPRTSASSGLRNITAEQTISEDLIVEGKLDVKDNTILERELTVQRGACIGESCQEGDEPWYLRLNGSWTSILFDDPPDGITAAHSWRLFANDFLGGGEYFTLLDIDASRRPFTIQGYAPANALYVRNNGNLGLGTATPAQDIHAMNGNTPTLRLEQDGSGGFSARTWDIGANATELFVKDVTNSSSVPFRIKAGAPSDSLTVNNTGRLDINANVSGDAAARIQNSSATGYSGTEYLDNGGNPSLFFGLDNANNNTRLNSFNNKPIVVLTNSTERLRVTSSGNIGIGTASPTHPLQMASGAHVTAGGVWTNASSRELKHDIQSLEAGEARATLARLEPVRFRYNADPADESLGFIAEDVPDLVATVDHKTLSPMDLVAVLTRVVQEQQKAIGDLQATVASLSEKLAAEEEKEDAGQPR